MRADHAALIEREAKFPTGHREGYAGFERTMQIMRDTFYEEFLRNSSQKYPNTNEVLAAIGDYPPEEFSNPYPMTPEQIASLTRAVQRKYVLRFKNIRRSWAHLVQYMPELMRKGAPPRDVLELSSAHGATLEILRHKGHRVVGNDFPNFLSRRNGLKSHLRRVNEFDPEQHRDDAGYLDENGVAQGWAYQPLIESIGLDVRLFDAGIVPYPFEDGSFDTLLTFDAIEHYCNPLDWIVLADEFTRVARRSVLIVANPVQEHMVADKDYMAAFHEAQNALRNYGRDGWECVHAGVYRHQLTVFKLARYA
ncbi:class I SAM-dependent methyltransferase [Gemmobacter denitrificans]|uniref:Class I SAM-dependent methyltransferase n=1 Tax=Gemmobacter denitrificans TaxID=3123040 RepID=A0ABU8BR95_9RHOB